MALKITKAHDPIEVRRITLTLYAAPGLGRTSTGFTAENPILFDFDAGAYRSAYRRDSIQMTSWDDVSAITDEDLAPYSTIVIDTAGRALDLLAIKLVRDDPKLARKTGELQLQGYGALKAAFAAWQKRIHALGKDVVLLCHMDEQRKGDDTIERLDVQGGTRQEIYKISDAMGRLFIDSGKRKLNFNPGETAFGKNPAMLPVYDVPHFDKEPLFLAKVIADTKAHLNRASAASTAEQARVDALRESFLALESPEDFTAKSKAMKDASPKDKAILMAVAAERNYVFDRKANVFVEDESEIPQ